MTDNNNKITIMTDCGNIQWGYVNRMSTGEINTDKEDAQKHSFVTTVFLKDYKNQ